MRYVYRIRGYFHRSIVMVLREQCYLVRKKYIGRLFIMEVAYITNQLSSFEISLAAANVACRLQTLLYIISVHRKPVFRRCVYVFDSVIPVYDILLWCPIQTWTHYDKKRTHMNLTTLFVTLLLQKPIVPFCEDNNIIMRYGSQRLKSSPNIFLPIVYIRI